VPPKYDATCLVHLNGVSNAHDHATPWCDAIAGAHIVRSAPERADLVSTHEAAVTFHIRCEDCDEASAD